VADPFNTKNPPTIDPQTKRSLEFDRNLDGGFLTIFLICVVLLFVQTNFAHQPHSFLFTLFMMFFAVVLIYHFRQDSKKLERLSERIPIAQFEHIFKSQIGNITRPNIRVVYDLPPEFDTEEIRQRLIRATDAAFYKSASNALPQPEELRLIILNGIADIVRELKIPVMNAQITDAAIPRTPPRSSGIQISR
jgi:hypothetical protein